MKQRDIQTTTKKAHQSSAMGIKFFFFIKNYILNSVWYCQINDRLLLSLLFFLKIYICFNY